MIIQNFERLNAIQNHVSLSAIGSTRFNLHLISYSALVIKIKLNFQVILHLYMSSNKEQLLKHHTEQHRHFIGNLVIQTVAYAHV